MALDRFILGLNLPTMAPYQLSGQNFNSFGYLNGRYLGANEDGVYSLNDAETYAGAEIDAYFRFLKTDFGIPESKRITGLMFGYEASNSLSIQLVADDINTEFFALPPVRGSQSQHGNYLPMTRTLEGRYFEFKISNVAGGDFSIDNIRAHIMILSKSPKGSVR